MSSKKIVCLFDVDGTLTPARKSVDASMLELLQTLRRKGIKVGVVGGSDLPKIREQLGDGIADQVDYCFAENGCVGFKAGVPVETSSVQTFLGEAKLQELINFTLHYIADLKIPVKRGTFIEFRNGMLNISPIGRNCSYEEREQFQEYDNTAHVRRDMVAALKQRFPTFGLRYSIGGMISFDVFPEGWDKTFCLRHVEPDHFDEIHFFGDKTFEGGNDHEIFADKRTIGHSVKGPADTMQILTELFLQN